MIQDTRMSSLYFRLDIFYKFELELRPSFFSGRCSVSNSWDYSFKNTKFKIKRRHHFVDWTNKQSRLTGSFLRKLCRECGEQPASCWWRWCRWCPHSKTPRTESRPLTPKPTKQRRGKNVAFIQCYYLKQILDSYLAKCADGGTEPLFCCMLKKSYCTQLVTIWEGDIWPFLFSDNKILNNLMYRSWINDILSRKNRMYRPYRTHISLPDYIKYVVNTDRRLYLAWERHRHWKTYQFRYPISHTTLLSLIKIIIESFCYRLSFLIAHKGPD